jgi:hypothetical protein
MVDCGCKFYAHRVHGVTSSSTLAHTAPVPDINLSQTDKHRSESTRASAGLPSVAGR